jgi:hypothetical protein
MLLSALSDDTARPLSSESQQGEEVGEIHESFGFAPLGVSQGLSTILLIQQRMQALLYKVFQTKPQSLSRREHTQRLVDSGCQTHWGQEISAISSRERSLNSRTVYRLAVTATARAFSATASAVVTRRQNTDSSIWQPKKCLSHPLPRAIAA